MSTERAAIVAVVLLLTAPMDKMAAEVKVFQLAMADLKEFFITRKCFDEHISTCRVIEGGFFFCRSNAHLDCRVCFVLFISYTL